MDIKVCKSPRMTGRERETHVIRVPDHIRVLNGIALNSHLVFNTKTCSKIALEVKKAYLSDLKANGNTCFVSSKTISLLELDSVSYIGDTLVAPDITLGCDPEFFIVDVNGGIVSAGTMFNKSGYIGHDGIMCEIRPKPSRHAKEVTETMRGLLRLAREVIGPEYNLVAASCFNGIAAGFHVHLGIPQTMLAHSLNNYILRYITRILDFYVGIPSALAERNEDAERRASVGVKYGKVGDHRGGLRTLEYRVPGGVMLKSPVLTTGVLALSKLVTGDAIARLHVQTADFKDINVLANIDKATKEMYPNIPDEVELRDLVNVTDLSHANRNLAAIMADISVMHEYEKYADDIANMFEAIKKNDISNDICQNWLI